MSGCELSASHSPVQPQACPVRHCLHISHIVLSNAHLLVAVSVCCCFFALMLAVPVNSSQLYGSSSTLRTSFEHIQNAHLGYKMVINNTVRQQSANGRVSFVLYGD